MRRAHNPRSPTGQPSDHRGKTASEPLAAFLHLCGGAVRVAGEEHLFRCPCRDRHTNGDAHPSGSVRLQEDGRLLVVCRAGCAIEDIVAAIGWTMADLMPPEATGAWNGRPGEKAKKLFPDLGAIATAAARLKKGGVESTHVYRDSDGQPVLAVVRVRLPNGSKEVPQARPERGGWVFGGIGKNRPLYNLPALLSSKPDAPVAITEGEQKADLLMQLGFLATTTSQGAGKAAHTDLSALEGRVVHLYGDNDTVGREHMQDVAERAYAAGASQVLLVHLPDLPPKGDIVDFHETQQEAGLNDEQIADQIRDAVANATEVPRQSNDAPADAQEDADEKAVVASAKLADQIVAMAKDAYLFHDEHGETHASFFVAGHRETWRIASRQFTLWLASRFYREHQVAVPPQAMSTAVATLSAMASFDGTCEAVYMRTARVDGAVWLDLGNETWQAAEVATCGWRLVDEPPVRFVRRVGMKALPIPQAGFDTIDPLFDLLHVEERDLRVLVTAWLVNAIMPLSSYPILSLTGEQGSGKSTFCRALQRLLDPHKVEGRSPPRNEEDIAVAAQQAHVLCYENLSSISTQLSDALCRVATGAGFAARKLYTDDEERQLAFCRPVIINGIGDLATRSDLADRVVSVHLEPIPRERRQTEAALWHAFDAMHPRLFGALLSLVSKAMGTGDMDVPLERMAEYSQLGAKVAIALGLAPDVFANAYRLNRDGSSLMALESSAIGPVLLRLVHKAPVQCPIGSLLFELQNAADKYELRHPDWPRTPRALGNELRRLSPNLARCGITILFPPRRKDGLWVHIAATSGPDVHHVHHVHPTGTSD